MPAQGERVSHHLQQFGFSIEMREILVSRLMEKITMSKSGVIFILVGLLVAAIAYSGVQYANLNNLSQELQESRNQCVELESKYEPTYEQETAKFNYLSEQYRELESQYLRLEYQVEMVNSGPIEERDAIAEAQREAEYWRDAYEAKPGPWQTVREFRNEEEMRLWLLQDNTDSNEYIANQFDCDDFARLLQARAYKDGYVMSIALVTQGENDWHFDNGCFIGNNFYYIEPQSDRFWLRCRID